MNLRSIPKTHRVAPFALSILVAAVAIAAPGPASAGTGHTSAFADTSRPVLFLHEIVVTGARYPRAYYQSPQALSYVSRAQLREISPVAIGDVLGTLPGVDNSKDSPWEQRPVLRGLGSQRVLVLMDGIPMNSARGNGPHPSLVDPSQIDHVEVVRGPSSVAYGSDALGGAINIITREARPGDGSTGVSGSVSASGSSAEKQGGGAVELAPRMGKFAGYFASGFRSEGDFRSPDGVVANSAFKDYNALFNLRFDPSSTMAIKGGYQLYRGSDIGIPGLTTPLANFGPGNTTQFSFRDYDRDLAHLSVDHHYSHAWIASSRVRVFYQAERRNFFSSEQIDSSFFTTYGIGRNGSRYRNTDQNRFFDLKTWGAQIQASSIQTDHYRFTFGLDAARDLTGGDNVRLRNYHFTSLATTDSSGAIATRVTQSVPNGHFDSYGVYFQNEWYLDPKWTLSTGGRWTNYHYRSDAGLAAPAAGPAPAQYFQALSVDQGSASGSVGVVYEAVRDLHLSFNVANGYRQPNAQDLFFNGPASVGTVLGDPGLKPEKSLSYDLGVRYERARLALSGNGFLSTYDDLIDAVDVTPPGNPPGAPHTYQYTNISKARIWGAEGEAEWMFRPQWRVRGTMAGAVGDITSREANLTLYGVDTDRSPLGGVPPLKGSLGVRWNSRDGHGWLEPSVRYSWRTNRLPLPTPGVGQLTDFKKEWGVFDVAGGWRFSTGQRVTLGVRNVGDRRYREALASLPNPGRSFVASVTTEF